MLIFIPLTQAATSYVTTFNNSLSAENISLTTIIPYVRNYTNYLVVPININVTYANITVKGILGNSSIFYEWAKYPS
jgi:hypothetical protein